VLKQQCYILHSLPLAMLVSTRPLPRATTSMILSAPPVRKSALRVSEQASPHAESIILSASSAESMILSAPPKRRWATMTAQWVVGWQSNCNGQQDGGGTMDGTMGGRQSRQCRSIAIGGKARWTAAAIMMDGGGMIAMDGGSSNGHNSSAMGSGTV
jgi:hypothetical protein